MPIDELNNEIDKKKEAIKKLLPQFSAMTDLTPEEAKKHDEMVEAWEREQDAANCNRFYMNIGASHNALLNAGFNKFKMCGETLAESNAQAIMRNFGIQYAEKIKKGEYINLIMTGKPGIGKSFLALSIAKEVCYARKDLSQYPKEWNLKGFMSAVYKTSDYLCAEMKAASSFAAKVNKYRLIDMYADVDLLIIDEIGRTNNKDERDTLFAILDKRYQEGKSSILISNYDMDKLAKSLGDALLNRLNEGCMMLPENVLDNAPNMRNSKLNKRFA